MRSTDHARKYALAKQAVRRVSRQERRRWMCLTVPRRLMRTVRYRRSMSARKLILSAETSSCGVKAMFRSRPPGRASSVALTW